MRPAVSTNGNALNFSGGPGALPESVLEATREAVIALPETGLSVLGMSHRSKWFSSVLEEAEANIRNLLGVPADYSVLFLQGGGSLQFSVIPLSFGASPDRPGAYVVSGYWSRKAFAEACRLGAATEAWDGGESGYSSLPALRDLRLRSDRDAFVHYVSNETVEGLQFPPLAGKLNAPVVSDMSSDFLSRPVNVATYDLIYAHSQKNLGPAGITVVIVSPEMMARVPEGLPSTLDYRVHREHKSNYNTPPVFAIYVTLLVTRWLLSEIGGLHAMHAINRRKAERLYGTLTRHGDALSLHAAESCRSQMNAAFRFRDPELQSSFLREAESAGFAGLDGHRSIGGVRVSMYNAISEAAVETLCSFIDDFLRPARAH